MQDEVLVAEWLQKEGCQVSGSNLSSAVSSLGRLLSLNHQFWKWEGGEWAVGCFLILNPGALQLGCCYQATNCWLAGV